MVFLCGLPINCVWPAVNSLYHFIYFLVLTVQLQNSTLLDQTIQNRLQCNNNKVRKASETVTGHVTTPRRAVSNERRGAGDLHVSCLTNSILSVHLLYIMDEAQAEQQALPLFCLMLQLHHRKSPMVLWLWDTAPLAELLIRPVASPLCCTIVYMWICRHTDTHTHSRLQWCLMRKSTPMFVLHIWNFKINNHTMLSLKFN